MSTRHRDNAQERASYVRTGSNDLMVNDPDGYNSQFPPIHWLSVSGGNGPTDWWYGLDSGGLRYPIGPHGPFINAGMGYAVVTRATSLIVGPLTAAPYRVLAEGQFGVPVPVPRWITDPMLLRPDQRFTDTVYPDVLQLPRNQFWSVWVRNALWYGLGAFIYQPDDTGQPLAGTLRNVDPRFLGTDRDTDGALHWVLDSGSTDPAAQFDRDGTLNLGPVEYRICVLRNPLSPVDTDGMSLGVFNLNPGAFKLAGQIATYMSGTFRSGVPNGYLKVETPGLTQPQADDLKSKWLANHGGDRRSIAVLNSTTQFVPLTFSPVDAAIGEVQRLSIADVAFAFGLDPLTLGVSLGNSATYNNLRDAWLNHRDFGLSPWIASVQDVLSALLAGTAGIVVNLDGFANPPAAERFASYRTAIDAGILTPNEARALEGLPPLPEPDLEPVEDSGPLVAEQPDDSSVTERARPRLAWRA